MVWRIFVVYRYTAMFEMSTYTFLLEFIHSRGEQWSSGILWYHRVRYALDPNNKWFSGIDLDHFESFIGPVTKNGTDKLLKHLDAFSQMESSTHLFML